MLSENLPTVGADVATSNADSARHAATSLLGACLAIQSLGLCGCSTVEWPNRPSASSSACDLRDGGIVCWGAGYSRELLPDERVRIEFESMETAQSAVVIASDPNLWSRECLVWAGCKVPPALVPMCSASVKALDWPDVLASADALSGHIVSVRGPLVAGYYGVTLPVSCAGCCLPSSRSVFVWGGITPLLLPEFQCKGDGSADCCDVPAYGQTVVATGRLEWEDKIYGSGSGWKLTGVSLCEE